MRAKKAPRNRSFPAFSDTLLATTAQAGGGVIAQMREKLKTAAGQAVYQWRKAIVEPVFGQIKEERRFRRFAFGGSTKVRAEWALVCLTHNLLKLWRAKLRLFTGSCDVSDPFASHRTPDLCRCQQLPPRTEPSVRQRSSPLPNLARPCTLSRRYSDRLLAPSVSLFRTSSAPTAGCGHLGKAALRQLWVLATRGQRRSIPATVRTRTKRAQWRKPLPGSGMWC